MPSSRAFGLSSSSAPSSRHANRAHTPSNDDQSDNSDDSYSRVKKSSASTKSSTHKSASHPIVSRSSKRLVEEHEHCDEIRPVKKSSTSSSQRRVRDDNQASEPSTFETLLTNEVFLDRADFDNWVEKKLFKLAAKREQMLEERLERLRSERDEIQEQYDELRKLRSTNPEQQLDEYKKVAEARYRHDKDLVNSLKAKVEAAEKRSKEAENGGAAVNIGGDRSISILNASVVRESVAPEVPDQRLEEMEKQHKKELAEAARIQKKLEEDVKMYKMQLEQEIAQSKAASKNANTSQPSAAQASLAAVEDEKAVRKLYEDLTGLVITGVEKIHPAEPFRRFKALFAQEDYYSILMDLEESSSKIASSTNAGNNGAKKEMRDDIVYVPKINDDRDSELLNSQMVPQEWLDALRFDRDMLFKWYEKTRKALLTDQARAKLRAREERSRH
ncbi:uncharacterized protein MEPE_01071 [Melanopsichium pennsylvanicum]|uniref:Monopolin complex subunit Csm1/Pcs1 C-terminal domain-containing protein n=2 Tax=Melanopsichium pennsylvanicum TaxID=63383 RepID=A0AAJ5C390_9BASI|nr:conserved hypothetical protein [Melanopsichium pennsylvanicum 4]SNX82365.1 uncharacterized protein MEPE_01071 [Melanopsichium pennsylvanicum]